MLGVVKRYPMPVFFGLACAFAWACWIPLFAVLKPASPNDPAMLLSLLGTLGPGLAAWLVTRRVHGKAGSRAFWQQLRRWHVGAQWYAVALLLTPALLVLATGMQRMIGGEVPPYPWGGLLPGVIVGLIVGLGEEPGWRGYALPALQTRYTALRASVIVGLMWAVWHLPMFFAVGAAAFTAQYALSVVVYVANFVAGAVLFTWLYNQTGGSLLLVVLFHMSYNVSLNTYWSSLEGSLSLLIAVVLWLAAACVVVLAGPRRLSRRPMSASPQPS